MFFGVSLSGIPLLNVVWDVRVLKTVDQFFKAVEFLGKYGADVHFDKEDDQDVKCKNGQKDQKITPETEIGIAGIIRWRNQIIRIPDSITIMTGGCKRGNRLIFSPLVNQTPIKGLIAKENHPSSIRPDKVVDQNWMPRNLFSLEVSQKTEQPQGNSKEHDKGQDACHGCCKTVTGSHCFGGDGKSFPAS